MTKKITPRITYNPLHLSIKKNVNENSYAHKPARLLILFDWFQTNEVLRLCLPVHASGSFITLTFEQQLTIVIILAKGTTVTKSLLLMGLGSLLTIKAIALCSAKRCCQNKKQQSQQESKQLYRTLSLFCVVGLVIIAINIAAIRLCHQ